MKIVKPVRPSANTGEARGLKRKRLRCRRILTLTSPTWDGRHRINTQAYLENTVNFALEGQVYNPIIEFEPIGAVGGHPKYPFNPYYGGFSSVALNQKYQAGILSRLFGPGKSVIRGGYART